MLEVLLALDEGSGTAGTADEVEDGAAVAAALVQDHGAAARRGAGLVELLLRRNDLGAEHRGLGNVAVDVGLDRREVLARGVEVGGELVHRILEALALVAQREQLVLRRRDLRGVLGLLPPDVVES